MKHLILAITALAMITASVKAELGETPKEFEPRRADETKAISFVVGGRKAEAYYSIWKGRNLTHYGLFYEGRAVVESFWFNDRHQMTDAEWAPFFKPYSKKFRLGEVIQGQDHDGGPISWAPLLHHNGARYGVVEYEHTKNRFGIYRADAWDYYSRTQGYVAVRQKSRTQLVYATGKQPDHNDEGTITYQPPPPPAYPDESWGDRAVRESKQQPQTTASVRAGLGATPSQMESSRPYAITPDNDGTTLNYMWLVRYRAFGYKPLWHAADFDKATGHAVSESFWFEDKHPMTPEEREILLRPYAAFNRRAANYTMYHAELKDINEITGVPNVEYKRSEHDEHSNYETFDLVAYDGSPIAMVMYDKVGNYLLIQKPPPQSKPQPTPEDENDCVIVATKHLNELGNSVPWKQMLVFVYVVDGKREAIGHAVAVFKRSDDGNVWVNDKSGSDQIATTSTDANEILRVLGEKYSERFHKQITLIGKFDKGP